MTPLEGWRVTGEYRYRGYEPGTYRDRSLQHAAQCTHASRMRPGILTPQVGHACLHFPNQNLQFLCGRDSTKSTRRDLLVMTGSFDIWGVLLHADGQKGVSPPAKGHESDLRKGHRSRRCVKCVVKAVGQQLVLSIYLFVMFLRALSSVSHQTESLLSLF